MNTIYILLGANLGSPVAQLHKAVLHLQDRLGAVTAQSSIYESEGWGVQDQPIFYNQALQIETSLGPAECLSICQQIESDLGRVRLEKWGARLIDIDILYFNNLVYQSEQLSIPHPLLQDRNFVLIPLCEIAEDYIHPILQKSNSQLRDASTDNLAVHKVALN